MLKQIIKRGNIYAKRYQYLSYCSFSDSCHGVKFAGFRQSAIHEDYIDLSVAKRFRE